MKSNYPYSEPLFFAAILPPALSGRDPPLPESPGFFPLCDLETADLFCIVSMSKQNSTY